MSEKLKIALLGCGIIGKKRLDAILSTGLGQIVAVADLNSERAESFARDYGVKAYLDAEPLLTEPEVDIVVIATANQALAELAEGALRAGKHVLVEKPGAISLEGVLAMQRAQAESPGNPLAKIGYNHRFHPAALQISRWLETSQHGPLLWIRGAYGHGGRPGYEKEWRFQKDLSGGGEIIDQGVHLLDLVQWWSEDPFRVTFAARQNAFYRSTEEDNGFLALKTDTGVEAFLHCSATQWKNIFRMEVGTRDALYVWEGLGNTNYGPERLTCYLRNQEGGAPGETTETFEGAAARSWEEEWRHFYGCLQGSGQPLYSPLQESKTIFEWLEEIHKKPVEVR
jgi:predicted dehydrogenase